MGEGLAISGWSVDDEIVEAIELPDRRFALGVVWHPEEDETRGSSRPWSMRRDGSGSGVSPRSGEAARGGTA